MSGPPARRTQGNNGAKGAKAALLLFISSANKLNSAPIAFSATDFLPQY
jgi:hypothetical protein